VNKADLIDAVAGVTGIEKKKAGEAVDAVIDQITRAVAKGEKVAITGFGVFEKLERKARTARNPATGAIVKLKKTHVPKFRAGTQFKDVVSGAKKLAKAAAPSKPAPAKKAPAKSSTAKKSTTKKVAAKKAPATKAAAKKTTAKKAPAKRSTAKKAAKRAGR
jgi:DNA-binding protein HU-beta